MKKQATFIALAMAGLMSASAASNGLKVYINPGHGGHDSDDRNVVIEPYKQGDPNGYWESNSNLEKGLALRDMLLEKGYDVEMSRVTNTTADDLPLSTIVRLANNSNADVFFSIHSNATGTSARRNFPLMLFRGYDDQPENAESKVLATILNNHLLENEVTYWTSKSLNIRGDWSFYKSWGTQGLGVLRGLAITGMLSEGSFHDYIPEAYRLMNKEFCWLEAYHFRRAIDEYLKQPGESKGHIFGRLNDSRSPRPGTYAKFGDDTFATVQTATVELYDEADKLVSSYVTETVNTNGVYGFKNLAPGKYSVRTKVDTHYDDELIVEVKPDLVTYANFKLNKVRKTAPEVLSYSPVWKDGDEGVLCNSPVVFNFNWDMDLDVTAAAFSITPEAEGTITWEDLNYRMVFTPSKAYTTNTRYTVTLDKTAAHAGGMTMEKPVTFSFVTTSRNYLDIIGHSPKDKEQIHYRNAAVEFRFDKRPDFSQVFSMVKCVDSDGKEIGFNSRTAKFSKSSLPYGSFMLPFQTDLEIGKTYTVTISDKFADPDGITLKEGVSVSFTAGDYGGEKPEHVLVNEMNDNTSFAYNEEQSAGVKTQSIAKNTKTALYGNAIDFKYTFADVEGGEVLWQNKAEETEVLTQSDIITIHVDGDLSENGLYLLFSSDVTEKYVFVTTLDFIGWRSFELPLTDLEGGQNYTFRGVKVVQNKALQNGSGTVTIDRILRKKDSGVSTLETDGFTLGPVPASEYLVANADYVILGMKLIDLNGRQVAATSGNALFVGDIEAGHYIAVVSSAGGTIARRVVIAH